VARAIVGHRGLLVVTNNLNAASILAANADAEVVVAGGLLRRMDGGLVGDLTTEMIAQFKVDIAVIGASAIDGDGDLLDFDLREVRVSRAILRQARRAILVADASKFARLAPVRIGSLADVQMLVTDLPVPEAIARRCAEWGTEIRVTGRGLAEDQGQPP
jgi:DeoR family glycerol-3-phosphate regulon repressor